MQNKYVNEFLATLAHELRNPLAPISTGLSLLEEVDDPDMKAQFIETMKRQVDHMTTMIDDLMDVSRITQNKVKLSKSNVDLREILRDAIDASETFISKNEHVLEINLPASPIWVYGDRTRLHQVFVNILTNAAKYTERGGKIELTAGEKNNLAFVKIKDNGLGIEEEQLESIFTMFTQMNALSSQSKSGLGIGLTLVKRLLQLHDANIQAYSEGLGKGSEFEVLIPLISTPVSKALHPEEEKSQELVSHEKLGRILVVDDNEDLTRLLKILLEKKNYEVNVAYDGTSALRQFSIMQPDYALIDLGLPDMDGFDLCMAMKEIDEKSETIFFSHSGLRNKEKIDKSVAVGFKEHFVKPVKTHVLLDALEKYSI